MGYGSFHILLSPVVFRVQNDDEFLGMVLVSGGYALYSQIGVFLEGDLPASFRLDFFQIPVQFRGKIKGSHGNLYVFLKLNFLNKKPRDK